MTPQQLPIEMLTQLLNFNLLMELTRIRYNLENQLLAQLKKNIQLHELFTVNQKRMSTRHGCKTEIESQSEYCTSNSSFSTPYKRKKCKRHGQKIANDTKNIPKNFGKAIITFIERNQRAVRVALEDGKVDYQTFVNSLRLKKRNLYSIYELRSLWMEESFIYAKQMRIISHYFLKKASLEYIFGSRISNYTGHIRYRNRFIEALKSPKSFTFIKF